MAKRRGKQAPTVKPSTTKAPTSTTEAPTSTTEAPTSTTEAPTSTTEAPPDTLPAGAIIHADGSIQLQPIENT